MNEYKNAGRTCRVDGCNKRALAKCLCSMHYSRVKLYGSLEGRKKPTAMDKLLRRMSISENGCWIWNGPTTSSGYGQIYEIGARKPSSAHRVSFAHFNGEIPRGMWVLHKCDCRLCFNPAHLFLGNQDDNMKDAASKDRTAHGTRSGSAKLTPSKVRKIRVAWKSGVADQYDLAKQYGCCQANIHMIVTGKTWTRIK